MTRPMPGPPECLPTGFPHEGAATNAPGCLLRARSYHANSKRLKDSECEREWDAAEEESWFALADHIRGDKQGHAERFDCSHDVAHTWHRFATRPHALEES